MCHVKNQICKVLTQYLPHAVKLLRNINQGRCQHVIKQCARILFTFKGRWIPQQVPEYGLTQHMKVADFSCMVLHCLLKKTKGSNVTHPPSAIDLSSEGRTINERTINERMMNER